MASSIDAVGAYRPRHLAERRLAVRAARRLRRAAEILVAAVVLGLLAVVAVGKLFLGLGLSPVLTGSMVPAFAPGDAVITKSVPPTSLRVGDVAIVSPPGSSSAYAHRITDVAVRNGTVVLSTKGDANPAPDSWRTALPTGRVTTVVGSVPYVGHPMTWVTDPRLRALAIALLGLLLTGAGVRSILVRPPARRPSVHVATGTSSAL